MISLLVIKTQDSSVRTVARRARNQGSIPCKGKTFSLLHSVQTGSGAHPDGYQGFIL
jgi:hypothetical protein